MTDSKFTRSAQGKPCQLMLEGCMPENNTVVFCHLNGAGMGMKALDIHGMYACVNCHDLIDDVSAFVPAAAAGIVTEKKVPAFDADQSES